MSEASHLYKYVGLNGKLCNITRFGMSAKYQLVMEEYGFSVDKVIAKYNELK